MPFYEYECKSCRHRFEEMQKISDSALTICPHCQQPDLVKLVSSPAFQLKGDGWYVTDFKNKDAKAKPESTPKTDTSSKSEKE